MCFWLTDANNTERAFTLIMTEYEYQDHRPQRCPPQQDLSVQTHCSAFWVGARLTGEVHFESLTEEKYI